MSNDRRQPPPVVCTLDPKQREARQIEWSDVGALALSTERLADGIVATFAPELAADIEALAARELSCCGTWLNIETRRRPDAIELELTTSNPDGLDMINRMAGVCR
ncbi:MAG: hypothetical protein ACR2QK_23375 [Acidimicrobiales bacterium]